MAGIVEDDEAALPSEVADVFTEPFGRFLRLNAASGIFLLVATGAALILSNTAWSTPFMQFWQTPVGLRFGGFEFGRSLQHWINDGLMTLFFFVVALELKRELVHGELRNWRVAALSLAGALGGMLVPVSIYLALLVNKPGFQGWGTVMATDAAFVIGCLALLGSRVPPSLRLFLVSLAIFDDVGAITVIAFGYGEPWPGRRWRLPPSVLPPFWASRVSGSEACRCMSSSARSSGSPSTLRASIRRLRASCLAS